jgi:hypothetical protein
VTAPAPAVSRILYVVRNETCGVTHPARCSLEATTAALLRLYCQHIPNPLLLCVAHKDRMREQQAAAGGRLTCPDCGAAVVVVQVEGIR